MNNIYSQDGYRLYQTSYDDDLKGTFLTVKYDLWGVGVTYTGYALLFLSMLLCLLHRQSGFRLLLRECMSKGILVLLLMFSITSYAEVQNSPLGGDIRGNVPRAITPEKASELARKQVVYNGRIAPVRTLALDFCQKVTGKRSFGKLSAEQLMLSIMLYPEDWQHVKMIKVEDDLLRRTLGIEGKYASMTDFFTPQGAYRLSPLYQQHKSTEDEMEKAILKVDERASLIVMLINGELFEPVPAGVEKPSAALVEAEMLYDALPWSLILFISAFILAVLSLVSMFMGSRFNFSFADPLDTPSNSPQGGVIGRADALRLPEQEYSSSPWGRSGRGFNFQFSIFNLLTLLLTLALAALYVLRWIIQDHIPLSNGYETMLFISLVSSILASLSALRHFRKVGLLTPLCLIITSFTLLVSHLSFMSPEMTPLMPVLQSPLLSIHVSIIMMSYALFAIITLMSIAVLILPLNSQLHLSCRLLLYPAVFLLCAGIFIGAIWANISWGTYWSWDPKETWALITLMVYAVALHGEAVPAFRNPRFYHAYLVFAFLSVLITYFGVNYLLGGMHSYA
ncbi:MAG: cytochrome c biogenesis protein CcsA [Prevotella sp.]|nr:cytochrome c biogenesis protein CcsA [Prevotella sp.]